MDSHSHPEFSGLDSRVSSVESSVGQLRERVNKVEKNLMRAVGELQQTVNEFVSEYRRNQTVQKAHNQLTEARRELDEEFGHFKEVRDLASEIIHVVQSGFVRRTVILDVTERLAIRTPRYWLAPAVLAVAAWLDGDQERYAESIKSALILDYSKTALFMTLLLRHQARTEDMREWISSYLTELEPANLPTEFTVVIEAVAGRTLGADSAPHLVRRMLSWYDQAARSRDAEAEETSQWERNLMGLAPAGDFAVAFPALASSNSDRELLRKLYEADTAIEAADQHFRDRFAEGVEVPADLDNKVSSLLKKLAEDPDPEEERILHRVRRAEALIETEDEAAAERRVLAEEADRARALNILSLVTRAAFPTGRRRSPTMTELLAIVMSQRFISAAAEKIHDRHQRPAQMEINVGRWRCSFSCSSDNETTPEALRQQADKLIGRLTSTIDGQTAEQQDWLRRRSVRQMAIAGGIAAALVVLAIIAGPTSVWGILALVAALGVFLYISLNRFVRLQGRMAALTYDGSQEKEELRRTLIQVREELTTLFAQERRSRDLLPELQAYLLGLTAGDAQRAIRFTTSPRENIELLSTAGEAPSAGSIGDGIENDGIARGFPEWTPRPPKRSHPLPGSTPPPEG